jgi:hypothetical protein
VAGRSASTL